VKVAVAIGRRLRPLLQRVAALAERYVPGVSTRNVKAIPEELCGYEFSADALSTMPIWRHGNIALRISAFRQVAMTRSYRRIF